MKNLIILSLLLLFCCTSKSQVQKNETQINIQTTLKNNNEVYITFTNKSNSSVEIKKPCMFNTYIKVQKDDEELNSLIRVKVDPACEYPVSYLNTNNSREYKFPFKINELYDLKEGEKYSMNVEYYIISNNKLVQKIVSDQYIFIWKN
ncbi:hypothetical protein [Chryseobacterium kwangjuense]|uniref:Lipoprotein n=1 Tax=Chryseobacterium kwangjuense TaxID=267125 RepID=A0A135WE08_9FLAO|nr:hypothetical protein [Chryseobacterium kwangjuense]KXH82962.1 hypothetical protein AU378_11025 [Chryseobacterium kwangjuense]